MLAPLLETADLLLFVVLAPDQRVALVARLVCAAHYLELRHLGEQP